MVNIRNAVTLKRKLECELFEAITAEFPAISHGKDGGQVAESVRLKSLQASAGELQALVAKGTQQLGRIKDLMRTAIRNIPDHPPCDKYPQIEELTKLMLEQFDKGVYKSVAQNLQPLPNQQSIRNSVLNLPKLETDIAKLDNCRKLLIQYYRLFRDLPKAGIDPESGMADYGTFKEAVESGFQTVIADGVETYLELLAGFTDNFLQIQTTVNNVISGSNRNILVNRKLPERLQELAEFVESSDIPGAAKKLQAHLQTKPPRAANHIPR